MSRYSNSSSLGRRTGAGIALAAGAALVLSACSTGEGADGSGDGGLKVVATTTQLTDFAHEVGGDDIELTGLLPVGGSAHHFDPSPSELVAVGEADVLIVNGAGLETFIDSVVEASGFDGTIVDASSGIDLDEAREITAEGAAESGHDEHAGDEHAAEDEHDHEAEEGHAEDEHAEGEQGHAGEEHSEDEHAEDEHAEDEHGHAEDEHDHGDVNPHLWTAPRYAEGMVGAIAEGLADADPDRASDYTERAEAYSERLHTLDDWIQTQFERVPENERLLVSGHDSLRYYLHDYGISFVGSILPSFEDNAEPSAAEIDELVHAIEESGVKAVFVESSMNPQLAETIANEAGVEVVDEESLFADSLGAEGSGGETYIAATVNNTRVILEAWGANVDEMPADLQ